MSCMRITMLIFTFTSNSLAAEQIIMRAAISIRPLFLGVLVKWQTERFLF